jgi:hypothetical protein
VGKIRLQNFGEINKKLRVMQKVITFSIDVNQLVARSEETFSVVEPIALNDLLREGWEIEDWSFLTDNPVNGKMPMLVVLSDDIFAEGEEELWEEDAYLDEDPEHEHEEDEDDEHEEEPEDEELDKE